jgi:hypothetical protein
MKAKEVQEDIKASLFVLLESARSVTELRIPRADGGPLSGLFSNFVDLAQAASEVNGTAPGIYVTLNPLKSSLEARVTNSLAAASSTVKDDDIRSRSWLLIDFDPIRKPNTPSTDPEHQAALEMARECRAWLRDREWPDPVLADSGNGGHLLYRINLPNDQSSKELVKDCLEALSLRFSNSQVVIDVANFNASRLCRVYGTVNGKGQPSEDRPHRPTKLLEMPDEMEIVDARQLKELAFTASAASKTNEKERLNEFDLAVWVSKNEVPIAADAPWNGGHKWILRRCPFDEAHEDRSAYIVQFADGGIAAGCLHASCAGRGWRELRALFEKNASLKPAPEPAASVKNRKLLLEIGNDLKLFSTPQGESYAVVLVKNHREQHRIDSRPFKDFLRYQYFLKTRTAARPQEIQDALAHFDAIARFDSPMEPVFVRVAEAGGMNYLDLADEGWRAVEFDATGWRIIDSPPVKFRRLPGMLPLPTPVTGGDINELREFLNLRSDDDWILFINALLAALLAHGPYPVLAMHGEAGSAKTTTGEIFRAMVDPNVSASRAMPKEIRDLMISANNAWTLVFDNLSYLPPWFSDCLCRLSTGGGFSTRQLYTNSEEVMFDGQRPIVLNGIEELATRTDLLDRSVLLDLPLIERYQEESKFWKKFDAAHARLLGALLDVAVKALRKLPSVQLIDVPRMADFATFATAAEPGLGLPRGAFMRAYNENRRNANAVALEASPIASLICDLAETGQWEGTAQQLLRKLRSKADEETLQQKGWPKAPRVLSGMLRRLATALRKAGIDVQFWRDDTPQRTKMISIKQRSPKGKVRASGRG